ncbi:hypothetical protein CF319_g6619 [Tilletia indica]|uniref:Uncharacterized protein n=1 Tax=Tilletia indica TaxID=43049 RepID=A0A177T623_9BASI|nr:hypothetical protein CF319_g6619 [Tilletia indica]KAE8238881.1 hypothetical protein A4X13_0g8341 [Tilletia indica]
MTSDGTSEANEEQHKSDSDLDIGSHRAPQTDTEPQGKSSSAPGNSDSDDEGETFDPEHWSKFLEALPFSSSYPKFPTGDLVQKFKLSETPDFQKGRDWVWRNKSKADVLIEGVGEGIQRLFVCAGVLECDRCGTVKRAPSDRNKKRLKKWLQQPCKGCITRRSKRARRRRAKKQALSEAQSGASSSEEDSGISSARLNTSRSLAGRF